MLGQVGKVLKLYADGDLRVAFGAQTWTFNPACLSAQPVEVDANLMTTENPNESGSKASCRDKGDSALTRALSPACMSPTSSFQFRLCHSCFQAVTFAATVAGFLCLSCAPGVISSCYFPVC